jgi:hypothetical protein
MAWRRKHGIDGGMGRAASAWALGVAKVSLPQEEKEVRPWVRFDCLRGRALAPAAWLEKF